MCFLSLLLLFVSSLQAQVTIGMDVQPNSGALLDLKEYNNVEAQNGGRNATKGMSLPRVSLTSLTPYTPSEFSASIGNTGDWDMTSHIGLTIYNVVDEPSCGILKGVYCWSGSQWMQISGVQPTRTVLGSFASDVAALKEFFNSNGGNTLGWDLDSDPTQWNGTTWTNDPIEINGICGNKRLTHLDVSAKGITSSAGLEKLTTLIILQCSDNTIPSLNTSKMQDLLGLYLSNNRLTSINTSANTKLKALICDFNRLTSINASANADLEALICGFNQLTNIDVSANTELKTLQCGGNQQLNNLNVSNNLLLESLHCFSAGLSSLNVSNNAELRDLQCGGNSFTALNVSANTQLIILDCNGNQLSALDVSTATQLQTLRCYSNQLSNLVLPTSASLTEIECYYNKLIALNISSYGNLIIFHCYDNQFVQNVLNSFTSNPNYCPHIDEFIVTPQYYPNTQNEDNNITKPTCP